jgi:hypothetical protein
VCSMFEDWVKQRSRGSFIDPYVLIMIVHSPRALLFPVGEGCAGTVQKFYLEWSASQNFDSSISVILNIWQSSCGYHGHQSDWLEAREVGLVSLFILDSWGLPVCPLIRKLTFVLQQSIEVGFDLFGQTLHHVIFSEVFRMCRELPDL